jgi:hypothetical protein
MRISLAIVIGLLMPTPVAYAENERELFKLAVMGNQVARESIASLSCNVQLEVGYPNTQRIRTGNYWRTSKFSRLQEESTIGTVDSFLTWPEGEMRQIIRRKPMGGRPAWDTRRELCRDTVLPLDVWRQMFLEFELLLQAPKGGVDAVRVNRESVEGKHTIRVSFTVDASTPIPVTYWLDAERNFLVWRREFGVRGDHSVDQITDVSEFRPGVYVPIRRVGRAYRNGKQIGAACFTLTNVRVNEPIAKTVLEIPRVPPGTLCSDFIRKEQYPIDETWRQIPGSKSRSISSNYGIPATSSDESHVRAQSESAAKSWTVWLVPISIVLLVTVGLALAWTRWRDRRIAT